jgi:hypothetical protein
MGKFPELLGSTSYLQMISFEMMLWKRELNWCGLEQDPKMSLEWW